MGAEPKKTLLALLTENYGELVAHVARRLGGSADSGDVVQEAFLRLHRLPAETRIENPRSYLFRVADNLALDHIRSRQRRERYFPGAPLYEVASDEPSAERRMDYRQRLAILEKAVADLPPKQRRAFVLHKFDGLSHSEVAREMGITRSGVEKLIAKALASCREQLERAH